MSDDFNDLKNAVNESAKRIAETLNKTAELAMLATKAMGEAVDLRSRARILIYCEYYYHVLKATQLRAEMELLFKGEQDNE